MNGSAGWNGSIHGDKIPMSDNASLWPVPNMDLCQNYTEAWLWLSWLQPSYLGLVSIMGLVGNCLVLTVFWLQRKPCSVADIYLGNLAAADLVMMICLPFWALTISRGYQWDFGEFLCKLVNVAISMNYICSILFLTLISLDRYLALVKPMSASPFRRRSWAKRVCVAIWIFGFIFSLPILVFRTVSYVKDPGVDACILAYPHPEWRVHHIIARNILGFMVPVLLMAYCTRLIVAALNDSREQGLPSLRTEKKATYLVLAVLAVFLICWTPHQVLHFLDTLDYYGVTHGCLWGHILDIGLQLSTYLGYSNSAINPILLVIVGKDFRKRAKEVFGKTLKPWSKDMTYMTVSYTSVNRLNESHRISIDNQHRKQIIL